MELKQINIPKVIFTSFKDERGDNKIVDTLLNEWEKKNPDLEVKYFSDNDLDEYFENHPRREVFEMIKSGVAKADYFRVCYLQSHGGTWFDFDFEPFTVEFPDVDSPLILYNMGYGNVSFMFMSSEAGQPIWEALLEEVDLRVTELTNKGGLDKVSFDLIDPNIHPHTGNGSCCIPCITGPRVLQYVLGVHSTGRHGMRGGPHHLEPENAYHTFKGFKFYYAKGQGGFERKTDTYRENLRAGYMWGTT